MITSITLENFKSWKFLNVDLKPLTFLFGANSSGKSSVLQAILLVKQTAEIQSRGSLLALGDDERYYFSFGSFDELLYRVQDSASDSKVTKKQYPTLTLGMKWFDNSDLNKRIQSWDFQVDSIEGKPRCLSLKYGIQIPSKSKSENFETDEFYLKTDISDVDIAQGEVYDLRTTGLPNNRQRAKSKGRQWYLSSPVNCFRPPINFFERVKEPGPVLDRVEAFGTLIDKIRYLGPLRDAPSRRPFSWTGSEPSDLNQSGKRFAEALLRQKEGEAGKLFKIGQKKVHSMEYVAHWLKKMGLIDSFKVEKIGGTNQHEVKVQKFHNSPRVPLTDVGFGVSQVIPIITLSCIAPKGSIILLEQPEIHLHPKVQAELFDFFLDISKQREIQFIIESHSEHLLRRLQRRVAEEELSLESVQVIFAEQCEGESKARVLNLHEDGGMDWPKDFFGREMEEFVAAKIKRMKKHINA